MASYYLKWGEERLEDKYYQDAQKQSIDVQKSILGDDGIDALADKTTTLKGMNPFESDDLAMASATLNLTNQQYYNLWHYLFSLVTLSTLIKILNLRAGE